MYYLNKSAQFQVACNLCGVKLNPKNFQKHMTLRCPRRTGTYLVKDKKRPEDKKKPHLYSFTIDENGTVSTPKQRCPYCQDEFSTSAYNRHDCRPRNSVNVLPRKSAPIPKERSNNAPVAQVARKSKEMTGDLSASRRLIENEATINEYELNEYEQDGSKNIGFMWRENGRYGSFPMHDDYSGEAFP